MDEPFCGYVRSVQGSPDKLDDATLVAAIAGGEVRAWNILVERYAQMIWAIGRSSGLPAVEAEDLVQAVFTQVIQTLDQIKDPAALASWIRTIAKREAWRQVARYRRISPNEQAESLHEGFSDDDFDLRIERQQAVRRALSTLGDRCRRLIQAFFSDVQVPSYDGLAGDFGVSPNSIGPTRRRCLDQLQAVLASEFPELFEKSS